MMADSVDFGGVFVGAGGVDWGWGCVWGNLGSLVGGLVCCPRRWGGWWMCWVVSLLRVFDGGILLLMLRKLAGGFIEVQCCL